MYLIRGTNVPDAYENFIWTFRAVSLQEQSRNGGVRAAQSATALEIYNPEQRVLFDQDRDANPFFHVMEFIWMMSGDKRVSWLAQFNQRMRQYSDDGETLPQSYGVRWRKHWPNDQVEWVINHLRSDPTSRRAVISMWDPNEDYHPSKDRPCNTTIYFRILAGHLNMLVCNRSNDAIWGMFGANCVHMTFLQELVARLIGVPLGMYSVVTMNLHVYDIHEYLLLAPPHSQNYYRIRGYETFPIIDPKKESYYDFIGDCSRFMAGEEVKTEWFSRVATPIRDAYLNKAWRSRLLPNIQAQDWRVACTLWSERRDERRDM